MPSPFSGPKMYCACPKFLSQPKNLTAFSSPVHVVFGQSLGRPIVRSFSHFFGRQNEKLSSLWGRVVIGGEIVVEQVAV